MFVSNTSPITHTPIRIVSLVPSITVLLHALGLETETIGITKFCIHPNNWYRNKIRVGGTKNVDIQKINTLQPDLIIANKEENVKEQIEALAANFPVLLTDVNNMEEAIQMIKEVGKITWKQPSANDIIEKIKLGFIQLSNQNKAIPPLKSVYLIWKDPYMTIGGDTFINNMMEHAGFENVFAHKTRYPTLSIEDIQESKCDVLLLSSEPYPFKQKHIDEFVQQLPGVKVCLVNGEMFSWYGSMLVEAPSYFEKLRASIKVSSLPM